MNQIISIVSDTGPLISLEKIQNGYDFIKKLYGQILIPRIVTLELYQREFSNWQNYQDFYGLGEIIIIIEEKRQILPILENLDEGEK